MVPKSGTYRLESYEIGPCFSFLGFTDAQIKIFGQTETLQKISESGGTFSWSTTYDLLPEFNNSITFKIGEEVESTKPWKMKTTTVKVNEDTLEHTIKFEAGVMKFTSSFDNYGLRLAGTLTTKDDHSTFYENYKRVVPQIDGFYVFEKHVGADEFMVKTTPGMDLAAARKFLKDYTYNIKVVNGIYTVRETFGSVSPPKEMSFEMDKAFDYDWEGVSWSIVVTEQGPGIYMYLMKQPNGMVTEMVFTHTDEGVNINQKEPSTGLSASYSMRRSPDWEGTWKMVASPGLGNLLGACGIPEPMKSKMAAAKWTTKVTRDTDGLYTDEQLSSFAPMPTIRWRYGEEFTVSMPGLPDTVCLVTETSRGAVMVKKFQDKVIVEEWTLTKDFLVGDSQLEGDSSSRCKMVFVRV